MQFEFGPDLPSDEEEALDERTPGDKTFFSACNDLENQMEQEEAMDERTPGDKVVFGKRNGFENKMEQIFLDFDNINAAFVKRDEFESKMQQIFNDFEDVRAKIRNLEQNFDKPIEYGADNQDTRNLLDVGVDMCARPSERSNFEEAVRVCSTDSSMTSPSIRQTPSAFKKDGYILHLSIWDVGILPFLPQFCFRSDQVMILLGLLLTLALQVVVFLVVIYNILGEVLNENHVREMLEWRVDHGHKGVDAQTGETKVARLCRGKLWSFEASEYAQMHAYLHKVIPGIAVNAAAIIIWVFTVMGEYRQCTEQLMALIYLPLLPPGQRSWNQREHGRIRLSGITASGRILAIVVVCVPRLICALILIFVGCQFLAQTVQITEIILNAVALAFLLQIDEEIADVVLSDRLHGIVSLMDGLPCGPRSSCTVAIQDAIRYIITVGMIFFSTFYWLLPFAENVQAAASALCSGNLDFTYSGGESSNPNITIMPLLRSNEFYPVCSAQANLSYLEQKYPTYNATAMARGRTKDVEAVNSNVDSKRIEQILQYAFGSSNCASRTLLSPPIDELTKKRSWTRILFNHGQQIEEDYAQTGPCVRIHDILRAALPTSVHPGTEALMSECPRFNISARGNQCSKPVHPGTCVWSWEAQSCEGMGFPGVIYESACEADIWLKCDTWTRAFNTSHPELNCELTKYCKPGFPTCLSASGWLELPVDDSRIFGDPNVAAGVKSAISHAFRVNAHRTDPWEIEEYDLSFYHGRNTSSAETTQGCNATVGSTTQVAPIQLCFGIDDDYVLSPKCVTKQIINGVLVEGCTMVGPRGKVGPWCAHGVEGEAAGWSYCSYCSSRCYGGFVSSPGEKKCALAFTAYGRSFLGCTGFRNNGMPWCSHESEYNNYKEKAWSTCTPCVQTPLPFCSSCQQVDSALAVTGGVLKRTPDISSVNSPCVFPFTYRTIVYFQCTTADYWRPWCATKASIGVWEGSFRPCACRERISEMPENRITSCMSGSADCIMVFYYLAGMNLRFNPRELLGANRSILASIRSETANHSLNISHATFNRTSFRLFSSMED